MLNLPRRLIGWTFALAGNFCTDCGRLFLCAAAWVLDIDIDKLDRMDLPDEWQ